MARLKSHRYHGKHRKEAITDGYNSDLYNVPQKSLKLRKGAITDGNILESPKARNFTKFNSKLFKIFGAITDG